MEEKLKPFNCLLKNKKILELIMKHISKKLYKPLNISIWKKEIIIEN